MLKLHDAALIDILGPLDRTSLCASIVLSDMYK
jgi:hypothetical protein